ncbi:MAG: glycosyltransferase [Actinomycetota bacterium]|nr:glycosyltransferase [Actinomycetota bacterium]
MPRPAVSVVVNTLDRADALEKLLKALDQITYPDFEVVVVTGPCTDHTDEVLAAWDGRVKHLRCSEANLSMSRNIGIAACDSAYVAFIDDDAVPEPCWLDELMAGFDHDPDGEVAGVGGWVYDHTGHSLQCDHTGADRLGNARPDYPRPLDVLSFPGSQRFPYAPGGNAVYRKDRLIAVGGFDEEYQYYLEETDLCARLIDRGWVIRQLDGGAIHHKFLPSAIRTSTKVLRDRFAVIKNKIYFSIVNGSEHHSMTEILDDDVEFCQHHRNDAVWHRDHGNMTADEAEASLASIDRAWSAGLAAGMRGRVALGFGPRRRHRPAPPYLPFRRGPVRPDRLRLCFVSQSLPPTVIGGIGRYVLDVARELAARGHEIHIITTGESHDTVDLEDGVWVHRILKDGPPVPGDRELLRGADLVVPDRIERNAAAVLAEVDRITRSGPLDAVYAAMWDVEHLEVMRRTDIPVVTALVTTFAITLRTRSEWSADPEFMEHFGRPQLELERWVLERSGTLHAISEAIRADVELTSEVRLDPDRVVVAPIGAVDRFPTLGDTARTTAAGSGADGSDADTTVLFVGRFEKRKGIDLLLAAVPSLLEQLPRVRVVTAGRTDLAGEHGRPYAEEFLERHDGAAWLDRVDLLGEIDDELLWQLYASADVLVAPSRFESFGLIYVEAMMAGIPVVAVDAGAAPEVVEHGATGLLVAADADALAAALVELAADPERRRTLGLAGRRRYEERFSVHRMADGIEGLITRAPTGALR